jgi:DNA polymerase-1
MAHFSEDKNLLQAFHENLDVHQMTAAEIFSCERKQVTAEQRRAAKAINFGLIYGMSEFGLAKQLGIGRQEALDYIHIYFERYPGVKEYMEQTKKLAHKQAYVETYFGRRLYLPDINHQNKMLQKASERAAINAPLQGTAADLIKIAMIHLDETLKQHSELQANLILQVHDELVFEAAESSIDALKPLVQQRMTHAAEFKVPLLVEIGVGDNWNTAH